MTLVLFNVVLYSLSAYPLKIFNLCWFLNSKAPVVI